MASFSAKASGQAPLILQLRPKTFFLGVSLVYEIRASGENNLGSASIPSVTRPAVIGTSTTEVAGEPLGAGADTPNTAIDITYSTLPTLPTGVVPGPYLLPLVYELLLPPGSEYVATNTRAILLFAKAIDGHSWTGGFTWEEL